MQGPKILETETYTFPDSLARWDFDLRDSGFHILLAKDVPEMIGGKIGGLCRAPDRNGRKREEIKGWILHPGEHGCLGNIETELDCANAIRSHPGTYSGMLEICPARRSFSILQEWLEKRPLNAGEYAVARRLARASARNFCYCKDLSVILFIGLLSGR